MMMVVVNGIAGFIGEIVAGIYLSFVFEPINSVIATIFVMGVARLGTSIVKAFLMKRDLDTLENWLKGVLAGGNGSHPGES